jgi:hypothetical protein
MIEEIASFVDAGLAVHWLHPRTKRPIGDDWSSKPVWSVDQLRASYAPGNNVGVRLGEPSLVAGHYLHVIDMDIRDPALLAEALAALRGFLPEYESLPFVISGSGGESRHFHFLTESPFRSKKLAHSVDKITDAAGKQHWAWEVELFGTGKQVAMPPSIHPDTGLAYRWGRPIDFEDLELGVGPFVPETRVATWAPAAVAPAEDDDDFGSVVRATPLLDLTREAIDGILKDLMTSGWCNDRDRWLTIGEALHHQFEGSPEGLAIFTELSRGAPTFDERQLVKVWRSFKGHARPVTFRSLIDAVKEVRFKASLDDYGDDFDEDDEDDLLGPADSRGGADPDEPTTDVDAPGRVKWETLLDLNSEGAVKSTLHNVELMLRHDVRFTGLARLNQLTLNECYRGEPGFGSNGRRRAKACRQLVGKVWELRDPINGDLWEKSHTASIRSLIEAPKTQGGYGIKITDRDIKDAIALVARDAGYHPIREFLEGLTWDGVERLDTWFIRYLGVPDNAYHRDAARLPLIAAVARVYEPGHKWDYVPIIEGGQGIRKSTLIAVLGRRWSAELNGDFSERQKLVEKMNGAWVLEIPELSGFSRHEVQDIKAAVSATSDKVRLSYRTDAQEYQRQSVMYGTTNDSEYLRDITGGRRFWPIRCGVRSIDIEAFEREVDQLWAEAHHAYRAMRATKPITAGPLPLYLSNPASADEALALQESRRAETQEEQWAAQIGAWLDAPLTDEHGFDEDGAAPVYRDQVTLREVWSHCFLKDIAQLTPAVTQQLGRAMGLLNWTSIGPRKMPSGKTARIYRRGRSTEALVA